MGFYIYFGVPGSGKTTHAAKVVYDNLKKGYPTFSNVPIFGAFMVGEKDIGVFNISGCDLVIDEASISYNSRKWKSLSQEAIAWYKYYRHYGVRNVYVYSQSFDDMDITLRRLADRYFLITRSVLPWLSCIREIDRKIDIDEQTHQISDSYFFRLLPHFLWLPTYWSMFDSWAAPVLAEKQWDALGFGDLDRTIGNRQLKEAYKILVSRKWRQRKEKVADFIKKLIPQKEPVPDEYVKSLMELKANEKT